MIDIPCDILEEAGCFKKKMYWRKLNNYLPFWQAYVTALCFQGYRRQNEYIVTQYPSAETMEDFWKMLWEHNSTTIVTLTDDQKVQLKVLCQSAASNSFLNFILSCWEEKQKAWMYSQTCHGSGHLGGKEIGSIASPFLPSKKKKGKQK